MSLLTTHLWKAFREVWRILHRLWLEVTGAVFLAMAAMGGISAWKEWRAYQAGDKPWEFLLALVFMVMMGSFGVYSFFRAWRIR